MKILTLAVLIALLPAASAWAETVASNDAVQTNPSPAEVQPLRVDSDHPSPATAAATSAATPQQQPGQVEQSVFTENHFSEGGLRNEAVGINPQFGILAFSDPSGNTDSRGIAGLTIDLNGLRHYYNEGGRPFFGASLGIFYSHLGTEDSNFLGSSSSSGNNGGTQLLVFPFDAKAGYTFGDIFRPSLHAGVSLVYNNLPIVPTGLEVNGTSTTAVHPNIGMDFEFGFGRTVAILLRPDWVISATTSLFSATCGVVFTIS